MLLPIEIIVMIGSQLEHIAMLSLSLTAKPVFEALRTSLELERAVRQKYRSIDIGSDIPRPFPYHHLLRQLLHDDRLAGYVINLTCGEYINLDDYGNYGLSAEEAKCRAESLPKFDGRTRTLLKNKIAQMPWISEQQRAGLLERMLTVGCESAVLAVLLCILVELRSLCPPHDWGDDVQEVVKSVACDHQAQNSSNAGDAILKTAFKPLNKLQIFRGHADNGVHGVDLERALVWMGLSSLKRVILWRCRTDNFRRGIEPTTLIRTPDIYLPDSSVTLGAIADFAKFIRAPCMIRQTFGDAGEYADNGPLAWDHCEINEEISRSCEGVELSIRKIKIELRYPASELHGYHCRDDLPKIPESPAWKSIGIEEDGDVYDWTKIHS